MKVKLYRQSGEIVEPAAREAYDADFRLAYDRVEKKVADIYNKKAGKLQLTPSMIMMERMLRYVERQLHKKHAIDIEIDFPKTAKSLTALITKYQDTPIMFAKKSEDSGIVAILMDSLNG